jgi:hypothetical protein
MRVSILGVFLALLPITSLADTEVSVPLKPAFEISEAIGLLISRDGTVQKMKPKISKDPSGASTIVSFPVTDDEMKEGLTASALILSKEGQYQYGPVIDVAKRVPALLPACPIEQLGEIRPAQLGYVKALITTRQRQREIASEKVRQLFTEEFLIRLVKLERAFGLYPGTPPSATDNPVELIDRLSRIVAAFDSSRSTLFAGTKVGKDVPK